MLGHCVTITSKQILYMSKQKENEIYLQGDCVDQIKKCREKKFHYSAITFPEEETAYFRAGANLLEFAFRWGRKHYF